MAFLISPADPRSNRGDQDISEQVEIIWADGVMLIDHQADVNAYLITLREAPDHIVLIKKVEFTLDSIKPNGLATGCTLVHYRLIGNTDLPYLP